MTREGKGSKGSRYAHQIVRFILLNKRRKREENGGEGMDGSVVNDENANNGNNNNNGNNCNASGEAHTNDNDASTTTGKGDGNNQDENQNQKQSGQSPTLHIPRIQKP